MQLASSGGGGDGGRGAPRAAHECGDDDQCQSTVPHGSLLVLRTPDAGAQARCGPSTLLQPTARVNDGASSSQGSFQVQSGARDKQSGAVEWPCSGGPPCPAPSLCG